MTAFIATTPECMEYLVLANPGAVITLTSKTAHLVLDDTVYIAKLAPSPLPTTPATTSDERAVVA